MRRFDRTLSVVLKSLSQGFYRTFLGPRRGFARTSWGSIEPFGGKSIFIQCGCWEELCSPYAVPNPSPTLDKNLAPMGPRILSSIGVGVWRKAPEAFPDSNTTLDTFQSAIFIRNPKKGAFARGALRKFVANCAPNLRKIAGTSFCTSEEGCAELSSRI